jgi:hypothetical protein
MIHPVTEISFLTLTEYPSTGEHHFVPLQGSLRLCLANHRSYWQERQFTTNNYSEKSDWYIPHGV